MSRTAPPRTLASTAIGAGRRRACRTIGNAPKVEWKEAALKARTVRIWSVVHTWSSLISTLFLLLLCITGLPLIFHHEIDELLGYDAKPEIAQPGAVKRSIDEIARTALANDPGRVLQYILWDKDEPNTVIAFTNNKVDGDPDAATLRAYDANTAKPLGSVGGGPMLIFLKLHVDMFAGQPGKLFLGAMGFLFLVAIISGVVLYWPLRDAEAWHAEDKSRRIAWFDWQYLLAPSPSPGRWWLAPLESSIHWPR